jgi:tetraacyldisaccharide 4'-kinase
MKKSIARWLEDVWYREMYISSVFMPLSMLYVDAMRLRKFLYRRGVFKSERLPVPVVIVGNITVGGTGKTPLVIWLAELLKQQGFKPGVISRGYGGANQQIQAVAADSNPAEVGDEAVVLARRCACPVFVGANRVAAGRALLANHHCDVIISDDGLQHLALQRDIEIVVIDGERRFGNCYCLPVGPLREPPERIKSVDLVVVNGGQDLQENEFAMRCQGEQLVNLFSGESKALSEFENSACHAVAGIGNPGRFFKQLAAHGLRCTEHAFPDHHVFTAADLKFKDAFPVLMTEKDAVKCRGFAELKYWFLPVTAALPETFSQQILTLLRQKIHG